MLRLNEQPDGLRLTTTTDEQSDRQDKQRPINVKPLQYSDDTLLGGFIT